MKIKFNQSVDFNGKVYYKDDELEVNKENIKDIWKLNEKGYIYPISYKEYQQFSENLTKKEVK